MLVQWCRAEPWQWLQVGETGARSSHCELQPHHPRRKHSRDKDTTISYFSNEMEVKGCASPAQPYWRTKWGPVSTRQHKVSHWIPRPVWKAVTRLGPRSIIISSTNNWSPIFTIAHYLKHLELYALYYFFKDLSSLLPFSPTLQFFFDVFPYYKLFVHMYIALCRNEVCKWSF